MNLNESENPLQYLESSEEEMMETDSDGDEMELLTNQIDSYYSQYKSDKEKNEKSYLEALEKKKGLPAQKQRELVSVNE